jgi:hypothetical protein
LSGGHDREASGKMVLNLKTARTLGQVAPTLLAITDEVIE